MPEGSANPGRRRLTAVVAGISLTISILFGLDLSDYRHQAVDKARAVSDNMARLLSERLDGSVREVDYVLRDVVDKARSGARGPALGRVVDAKRLTLKQASSLSVLDPWGRELASSPPDANLEAERSCSAVFAADGSLGATTLAVFCSLKIANSRFNLSRRWLRRSSRRCVVRISTTKYSDANDAAPDSHGKGGGSNGR